MLKTLDAIFQFRDDTVILNEEALYEDRTDKHGKTRSDGWSLRFPVNGVFLTPVHSPFIYQSREALIKQPFL
jgi:hypothetical protein